MRKNPHGSWRISTPQYARTALALAGICLGVSLGAAEEITLHWTAPAENGATGGAASYYEMRFREEPVGADTAEWWNGAEPVSGLPAPSEPGRVDSVTVAGLEKGETYWFVARSGDEADNLSGYSIPLEVELPGDQPPPEPPAVLDVFVEYFLTDSVLVRWTTDRPAAGILRYGTDPDYGFSVSPPGAAAEHAVLLDGLPEGQTIHFQIVAVDGAARDSTGDSTFTAPDPPPARPQGLAVHLSGDAAAFVWMPNGEEDLALYHVYHTALGRSDTPVLWESRFDDAVAGSNPEGFVEIDSAGAPADLFHLEEMSGRGMVLRGTASGGSSRLLYGEGSGWTDWEATGSVRFDEGAGADLFLRVSGGDAYRIGIGPEGALVSAGEGGAAPERTGGAIPSYEPDVWYRFRVLVWEKEGVLRLGAAVWPEGTDEPARFPLRSVDGGGGRPPSGTFGFGVRGEGSVWFDDIVVTALPGEERRMSTLFTFANLSDLDSDSSYSFWVQATDGAGGESAPAGPEVVLLETPAPGDTVAPSTVADFSVAAGPEEDQAMLFWTAPGDDGGSGTAALYDIRWAADTLHEGNWSSATILAAGEPSAAGSPESLLASGLPAGTDCRFGLIAADEAGNLSGLSNTVRYLVPGDTLAPLLSDIRAGAISSVTARIDWDLNEPANGRVEYGKTVAYEIGSVGESARVLHHHITLNGLEPSTLYHYRVRSSDASGNEAVSGDRTFTTAEAPPPAEPVIAGVGVEAVSDSDAVVVFTTDIPSLGSVDFGPSVSYGNMAAGESETTAHRILLAPLDHGRVYHFRVRAFSEGGETVGEDRTFTTSVEGNPPVISGVAVSVTDSTARIVWVTDEAAVGFVEYGPTAAYGAFTDPTTEYRVDHEALLSDLAPESSYHFRIRAEDHYGNFSYSEDSIFVTGGAPDTGPPVVSGARVEDVTHECAAVLWSTDEAAYGSVLYGTDPSCSDDERAGAEGAATAHRVVLDALLPSTEYFCRAVARDEKGRESLSVLLSFTTAAAPDTTAPVISEIRVDDVEEEGVTIFWITGEAARGAVHYGLLSADEDSLEEEEETLEHEVRLDGLLPGGVYFYRVTAADESGNRAESEVRSFALVLPDTVPPAVLDPSIVHEGDTAATVSWTSDEPARGRVEYGPDSTFGFATAMEGDLSTQHEARVGGLEPGSTIYFRIVQEDGAGNRGVSETRVFSLPAADHTGPVVLEMEVVDPDPTGATVLWKTDEPSCGRVLFGLTASCGDSTPVDSVLSLEHAIRVDGLSPMTVYYYRILCSDSAGNQTLTAIESFMTEGFMDTVPPRFGSIQLADLGAGKARILWETDEPSVCSVEYGPDSTLGMSLAKADAFGCAHRFDLFGLETGRFYYFRAAARDTAGNEARSGLLSLFMEDEDTTEASPALDVRVEAGIRDAAVIWETGGPTSGRVDYGTDPGCAENAEDPALVTAHRIVLEGLEPSTYYYYRISGEDAEGHLLELGGLGFRTLPDTLPEVSGMAAVPGEDRVLLFWSVNRLAAGAVEIAREGSDFAAAAAAGDLFTYEHADTVGGLQPGVLYSWRVRGVTLAGVSFLSGVEDFRTADDVTPPAAPIGLTAERKGETVRLSWENGGGESPDSLILHRRLLPGGEWTVVWVGSAGMTEHVDPLAPEERGAYQKAEYRIEAVDGCGNRCFGETFTVEIGAPAAIVLLPNRPNPFNPITTIGFELPASAGATPVRLAVYNIRGEEVRLLVDEILPDGRRHEVLWDGSDYRGNPVASGAYYYRLTAPAYSETKKMVLIR